MPAHHQSVHEHLVAALARLRDAEHDAVGLFAQVLDERLYRRLGHATIELYATESLGLTPGRTRQFIRLARALETLPATRTALGDGRLTWTKARTLAAVATPRTEEQWVATAAAVNSRELEAKVRTAKARNRRERDRLRRHRGQAAMVLGPAEAATTPPVETPVSVTLTLSPADHARLEALLEKLRKKGRRESRERLVLEGLDALAGAGAPRENDASHYRIVGYKCTTCNTTTVDGRPVSPARAAAMECDAVHVSADPSVPNRSTVPPSVRRAVLARDGHRCTTPGCGATRFLEVHHVVPRSRGGMHTPENLRTLCSACHAYTHERGG